MTKKRWISLLVGALALALAGPVQAYVITQGSSVNFSWSAAGGGFDLAGNGSITAAGLSQPSGGDPGSLRLNVMLTNTTANAGTDGKDARLTAWGFGIDPDATQVTFSDSADSTGMVGADLSDLPSLKLIEVCAFGGNNCNGGADGGIYGGGRSDYFTLLIEGPFGSTVNLNPFGFKYQTSNGSFEFACDTSAAAGQLQCDTSRPPTSVSEPGMLALFAAVAMAGTVSRRLATSSRPSRR